MDGNEEDEAANWKIGLNLFGLCMDDGQVWFRWGDGNGLIIVLAIYNHESIGILTNSSIKLDGWDSHNFNLNGLC